MHIEPLTITLKCKEGSDQEKIGNYIHVHISCCAQPTLFSKIAFSISLYNFGFKSYIDSDFEHRIASTSNFDEGTVLLH